MASPDAARRLDDLTGRRLLRADEVCDRFESAWRRGERPRPEDFARPLPADDRPVAIRELIRVDVEYRVRLGESPTPDDYAFDHAPDLAWVERIIAAEAGADRTVLSAARSRGGTAAAVPGCVGHYRLVEILGSGGTGTVWKAVDEELDRVVALKIPHARAASADFLARFSREARVVARLRHPGIVTLHGILQWEGRPVLVSDFVEGSSLGELLARRKLIPDEAARIAARLAETLAYVHEMGAVHRDIKPANVMIPRARGGAPDADDPEHPRLLDFGLAILAGAESLLTRDGDLLGTPAYMSPEQAAGRVREVDARSDVYSLGVVLYQMLCGDAPFRGPHSPVVRRIQEESPRRPRIINPAIPRDLEVIVLKAMAKDRGGRYGTASELADDLNRYLRGEPIRARPAGPGRRLLYWMRRRPALAALSATAILAGLATVAAITGWAYSGRLRTALVATDAARHAEARRRLEAEFNLYLHRIGLSAREWTTGNVGHAERLLDECPPELRGWEWRHLKSLCHRDVRTIRHQRAGEPSSTVVAVAYSPDGRSLASADRDGDVRLWDAETGRQRHRLEGHAQPVRALAYSPDGRRLASASGDDTIRLWDAGGGAPVRTIRCGGHFPCSVASSPDGGLVASGSGYRRDEYGPGDPHDGVVKVWDARTGREVRAFRGHTQHVLGVAFRPDGKRLASASGGWRTHDAFERRPGEIKAWSLETGAEVRTLDGHTGPIAAIAYSPDGRLLASAGGDRTLRTWDAETGRPLVTAWGHRDWVSGLGFGPSGDWIATSSHDGTVRIWEAANGRERAILRGHTDAVACLSVRPDGRRIASGGSDRTIKVWDPDRPQPALVLRGRRGPVCALAFLPDGHRLATASAPLGEGDRVHPEVWLWDARTGERLRRFPCPPGLLFAVAASPDGRSLAAGVGRRALVWDIETGCETATIAVVPEEVPGGDRLRESVRGLAFAADGKRLVTASQRPSPGPSGPRWRQVISEWDLATGRELRAIVGDFPISRNVAVSPWGGAIAFARNSYEVTPAPAGSEGPLRTFEAHDRVVDGLAFSADGARLATGSWDQTAKVWDVSAIRSGASRGPSLVLRGHMGVVTGVAFSPDGLRLATASEDQTVRLWDARTGREIMALSGQAGAALAVAFSPDGLRLAAAGGDGTARVWGAPP